MLWEQWVEGSNPFTPTNKIHVWFAPSGQAPDLPEVCVQIQVQNRQASLSSPPGGRLLLGRHPLVQPVDGCRQCGVAGHRCVVERDADGTPGDTRLFRCR